MISVNKYFITQEGYYYEGDRARSSDIEVDQRPDFMHKYENGEWVLDISIYASRKIDDFSTACETAIVAGFSSDALGSTHFYKFDRDDQLNLLSAQGSSGHIKCSTDNENWTYLSHTDTQLAQVLNDGRIHKLTQLVKFDTLKQQILNASTKEEIDLIEW